MNLYFPYLGPFNDYDLYSRNSLLDFCKKLLNFNIYYVLNFGYLKVLFIRKVERGVWAREGKGEREPISQTHLLSFFMMKLASWG